MGCGNAVQTAREEFGHVKRENEEMRTNLNQLRVRADTSSLHLSRELQKASELTAALKLTQAALRALGKTLAEVQRQCFGLQQDWDWSASMEPEQLVESVETVLGQFQHNALQFMEDIANIMRESAPLLEEEHPSALFPTIQTLWSALQSCIQHKDIEIKDLREEVARYKQQTASLEQTLASQGFHLASCESASVSFEAEVEVCSSVSPASSD